MRCVALVTVRIALAALAIAMLAWWLWHAESTVLWSHAVLVAVAAVAGLWQRLRWRTSRNAVASDHHADRGSLAEQNASTAVFWVIAVALGMLSFNGHWLTGEDQRAWQPAIHDEFSYLFQAKTFLAGRLWHPGHPTLPRLFDQIHVLNEGKFASRYFPGTGLWLAPFLAMGFPLAGQWLAGSLATMLVFGSTLQITSLRAAVVAGLVMAVSPLVLLLGNFMTASQPTLLGMSLFLCAFLRMRRTGSAWFAILAGFGLTFAMLCRPLTAAALAFPFGLWCLAESIRDQSRRRLLIPLAAPVLCGLLALFLYNQQITGSGWISPWQQYNSVYTPSHRYGFNNVTLDTGPRIDRDYNDFADNLTPDLAFRNARRRMVSSWTLIVGIVPLSLAALVFATGLRRLDEASLALLSSAACLHLAYSFYWFAGVFQCHYVAEATGCWAILFACAADAASRRNGGGGAALKILFLGTTMLGLAEAYGAYGTGGYRDASDGFRSFRNRHTAFADLVQQHTGTVRALVLVPEPPLNLHVDYVVNDPQLRNRVLFGRHYADLDEQQIAKEFPDRQVYVFDERRFEIHPLVNDERE
ncbi:MAG: glycosyltransferase family 39 protein [Planctomycetaceae bacterium]